MAWWRTRWARVGSVAAGAALLPLVLAGCQLLSVQVISVTGTYEPYNPMLTGGGIPAEQVDFDVNGYTTAQGELICLIEVFDDSGQIVGSTVAEAATNANSSGTIDESIPVEITGNIFNGPPSDALVRCGGNGLPPGTPVDAKSR